MHMLAQTSSVLATLPASSMLPGINAGMSFTMLRSVEPLFAGAAEGQLLRERLKELGSAARSVVTLVPALSGFDRRLLAVQAKLYGQAVS